MLLYIKAAIAAKDPALFAQTCGRFVRGTFEKVPRIRLTLFWIGVSKNENRKELTACIKTYTVTI
jgi:hypothetical protein